MKLRPPSVLFDLAESANEIKKGSINIIGFEFDGTACFRKGTVDGPDAIRDVMTGIETYSPYLNRDLEDARTMYDLGNLPAKESKDPETNWKNGTDFFFKLTDGLNLRDTKTKILTLGGEHSISYAPIKKYLNDFEDLVLIHLDAHADLRDGYEGYHFSHASIIRRVLDHLGKSHSLIQYGIRSGTKDEYQWMRENKTISNSLEEFLEKVLAIDESRPIYLTLDLDFFDPAYMPGTGTPEAGGETFHSYIKLMKILEKKNLVGADVVELAPNIDSTGNSSVFAAKVVREIILSLGRL